MDVDGLKVEMDQRFDAVDRRFEAVDRRFDAVDRRFEDMLALIEATTAETRRAMLEQGERLHREIREEGERTRRHFDVAVEQIKSERNLVLDIALAADARAGRLTATNAADHVEFSVRLDDHEIRLTRLERKNEP